MVNELLTAAAAGYPRSPAPPAAGWWVHPLRKLLSCKRGVVDIYPQREKVPDAGASGQGVCNRDGAASGEGDCGSAPCFGLTASGETKAGDFFGSSAVFGPCSLLRGLSSSPKIFSGGRLSVASGIVSFSSSIEAHPARPKAANTAIKTGASRAQARIENLVTSQRGPIRTYAGKRNLTHRDAGDPTRHRTRSPSRCSRCCAAPSA